MLRGQRRGPGRRSASWAGLVGGVIALAAHQRNSLGEGVRAVVQVAPGFFDAEAGAGGPTGRLREGAGVDPLDEGGVELKVGRYAQGQVVGREKLVTAEVVDALGGLPGQHPAAFGQVFGQGRRAPLVGHDFNALARPERIAHPKHEVGAAVVVGHAVHQHGTGNGPAAGQLIKCIFADND